MAVAAPFNLKGWIEENRHLLRPPVGNKAIWNDQFLVMVVGGPNARTDYHINPGEELFYQVEGDIVLKIIDDGAPRDVAIREGDLFVLPARVPHSPRRPANTVGLVVEQPKAHTEEHHLRWYCEKCRNVLHDVAFIPKDIGAQIKTALAEFAGDERLRTCKACAAMHG